MNRVTTTVSWLSLILGLSGCSGPQPASFDSTRAGAIMTRLRNRHGGVERFRHFEGVVFSYRLTFRDEIRQFDQVGFRFGDSDHLWLRKQPGGENLLVTLKAQAARIDELKAVARAAVTPDGSAGVTRIRPADGPVTQMGFHEPEVDFALRSIPFLLEPSLMTSTGRWSFRTLVAPGHEDRVEKRVEIEPWPTFPVDGNYLLEDDPRTGLVSRVLYRGSHPLVRRRTQLVTFEDYTTVQSLKVARRRVHRRPVDAEEQKLLRNPFVPPRPVREERFLIEQLDRIRFLTAEEADELLPLPEDDDNHPTKSAPAAATR